MDKLYISKDLFEHILICLDDPEKFDSPKLGDDIVVSSQVLLKEITSMSFHCFTLLSEETEERKDFEVVVTDKSKMKEPDIIVNASDIINSSDVKNIETGSFVSLPGGFNGVVMHKDDEFIDIEIDTPGGKKIVRINNDLTHESEKTPENFEPETVAGNEVEQILSENSEYYMKNIFSEDFFDALIKNEKVKEVLAKDVPITKAEFEKISLKALKAGSLIPNPNNVFRMGKKDNAFNAIGISESSSRVLIKAVDTNNQYILTYPKLYFKPTYSASELGFTIQDFHRISYLFGEAPVSVPINIDGHNFPFEVFNINKDKKVLLCKCNYKDKTFRTEVQF